MKLPIYMDYNATTPVDPRVLEAMLPYFTEKFGNAASRSHAFGWAAEEAVEKGRAQIAAVIGATEKEMVVTSGSTESNNLAILGAVEMYKEKGNHVITCATEHKAVLDTCKYFETRGGQVTCLVPDRYGKISVEQVERAVTDKTILITLMAANNEIGTIHSIAEIGKLAHARGVLFHTDATQAIGKVKIDVNEMNIDLLSMSGHKIYGPKGVGALYVRRKNPRVKLSPLIHGGGHERGMRSGTLNVPGIVGFGRACEIAKAEMGAEVSRLTALRDRLEQAIRKELDFVHLNGHPTDRLCTTLNLSFAYVEGESLIMGINDIAVSSGSACTSASLEPSYVLRALGVGDDLAHSSIRFSLGRFTTEEDVDHAARSVVKAVKRLRELSPLYEMAKEGVDLQSVKWNAH